MSCKFEIVPEFSFKITYDNLTLSVNAVKAHKISDSLLLVKNSSKIILRISDSHCQTPPVSYLP